MALTCHMWYNQETNIQQDETVMVSESTYLSEEQEERFKVSEEALLEDEWSEQIKLSRKKDEGMLPTLDRVITAQVRTAVIRIIIEAGEEDITITSQGNLLDIFLKGLPVDRLSNVSIILRIITILPEREASKVLIENLITYAGLLPESSEMSIRDIEISWAKKILSCLDYLRSHKANVNHFELLSLFAYINKKNNYKYCMGSQGILNQMQFWMNTPDQTQSLEQSDQMETEPHIPTLSLEQSDQMETEPHTSVGSEDKENNSQDNSENVSKVNRGMIGRKVLSPINSLEEEDTLDRNFIINTPVKSTEGRGINTNSLDGSKFSYCVREDQIQNFVFDGPAHKIEVKVTPIKTKFETVWDDELKFKLMETFLKYCDDEKVLNCVQGRWGLLRNQCIKFLNLEVRAEEEIVWKEITKSGTMADKLFRQVRIVH